MQQCENTTNDLTKTQLELATKLVVRGSTAAGAENKKEVSA